MTTLSTELSCIACGQKGLAAAPAGASIADAELPSGWRLLLVDPLLPVCSERCADLIVHARTRR